MFIYTLESATQEIIDLKTNNKFSYINIITQTLKYKDLYNFILGEFNKLYPNYENESLATKIFFILNQDEPMICPYGNKRKVYNGGKIRCKLGCSCVHELKQQTWMRTLGTDSPLRSAVCMAKKENTCLEKYGVTHTFLLEEIRDKSKKTWMENYGVDCPLKSKEINENKKKTIRERYGADHISQVPELIKAKSEKYMELHGYSHPWANPEIQEQIKETMIEKYGVDKPSKLQYIQDKAKNTCLERYGVEWAMQSPEFSEARANTCLERYGAKSVFSLPEFQNKIKETRIANGSMIDPQLRTEKEKYWLEVMKITERNWNEHQDKINPNNLDRKYEENHLDHIYSIFQGFKDNIPPEIIGHWTNLQLLPASENMNKNWRCDKSKEQLFEDYFSACNPTEKVI